MQLTVHNVKEAMLRCLYTEEESANWIEPPDGSIKTEGITATFYFHPGRVDAEKHNIALMLAQLPDTFHLGTGGGCSFPAACYDTDGAQWGEHPDVESIFVLGMAAGYVTLVLPRDMWDILPGRMPYYVIDLDAGEA